MFGDDKSLLKRQYLEGTTIFKSGDAADEAYLIEEGEVHIYRQENGVRHNLAVLGPGDIFGEMALVTNQDRTSTAEAGKKTLLVIITKQQLNEKLENSDPLTKALVHMFIKRLYRSNDEKQGKVA
ncbi:MAG: cyclic nucleotide-binding domain-containing protein [Rhodospirillales bacterium]|nr:cyclic nucleotide-binding domain-containing protein [Rhodospirillales bacterium]